MKRTPLLVLLVSLGTAPTVALAQAPKSAQAPKPAQAPKSAQAPAPAQQQDLIAKGQALFDDQQYEESIQALSAALLRPNNTKEQKVEIYRLLALDYITLGRREEAESAVRGLLVQKPDYQLPANESPRFREFFAEVRKKWEAEGRPGLEQPVQKPPEAPPATLRHQSPPQVDPNKDVTLRAQVLDPSGKTTHVRVYYRTGTRGDFAEGDADLDERGNVEAKIPASAVKPPILEYYLVALDESGGATASRGDSATALRIAVSEPSKGWILPVAIGGSVLGAAAIVGGLALAGVFDGSSSPSRPQSTVSINVGEAGFRFR